MLVASSRRSRPCAQTAQTHTGEMRNRPSGAYAKKAEPHRWKLRFVRQLSRHAAVRDLRDTADCSDIGSALTRQGAVRADDSVDWPICEDLVEHRSGLKPVAVDLCPAILKGSPATESSIRIRVVDCEGYRADRISACGPRLRRRHQHGEVEVSACHSKLGLVWAATEGVIQSAATKPEVYRRTLARWLEPTDAFGAHRTCAIMSRVNESMGP